MPRNIILPETYLLSEFVVDARKSMKMSGVGLARKAGCSYITVYNIENCESNPSWGMVRRILEALGVSILQYALWEKERTENGKI